ncbi:uncharacterized protein [Dysidea avara]|uniref:uncharacterized protein isoform X2 n=1 Tax=Dysidea avara TaxID=196820 RepID=UPI00331C59B0
MIICGGDGFQGASPSMHSQQHSSGQQSNSGQQMVYPTEDVNLVLSDCQPLLSPPPAYDALKIDQSQAMPVVVVQQQPHFIVAASQSVAGADYIWKTYLLCSISCVVLSICSPPSLLFAIPAMICSLMSYASYNSGDNEGGSRHARLSLGFIAIAFIVFIIILVIVVILKTT